MTLWDLYTSVKLAYRSRLCLPRRQPDFHPQPAGWRAAEPTRAIVHRDEIGDDRQTEAGARLGLVEAAAAGGRFIDLLGGQTGTVVVDQQHQPAGVAIARRALV